MFAEWNWMSALLGAFVGLLVGTALGRARPPKG